MGNHLSRKLEGEVTEIPGEGPPLIFRRIRSESGFSDGENLLSWENLEAFLESINSAVNLLEENPSEAVVKKLSASKGTGLQIIEFLRNKNTTRADLRENKRSAWSKMSRQEFMVENLICNLKSKMNEIVFARTTILDEHLSQDVKRLKLDDVVEPYVFVMKMFEDEDEDYPYRYFRCSETQTMITVSEYFLRFCILFLEIIVVALSIVPSHQTFVLFDYLPEMMNILKRYKSKCVEMRLSYLVKSRFLVNDGNQNHTGIRFRDEFDCFGNGWTYTVFPDNGTNSEELKKRKMSAKEKFQRYKSQTKNVYEAPFDNVINCVQGLMEKLNQLNSMTMT